MKNKMEHENLVKYGVMRLQLQLQNMLISSVSLFR